MTKNKKHSPKAIAQRLSKPFHGNYFKDMVYGGMDGTVTTFAIVAGAYGANFSIRVIVIMGLAKLVADALSMAIANYLGTKTEEDEFKKIKALEKEAIKISPKEEIEEIRQIYRLKKFEGLLLERIVKHITNHPKLWVNTMLKEEYGLSFIYKNSFFAAIITFNSFILFGGIPLLPFLLNLDHKFTLSFFLASLSFFTIGALKSRISVSSWLYSGLTTLIIGTLTAIVAYEIGYICHLYFTIPLD